MLFNIQMCNVRLGSPWTSKLLASKAPPAHLSECLVHKLFYFYVNGLKPWLQLGAANNHKVIIKNII
jgi:hypothetical protein